MIASTKAAAVFMGRRRRLAFVRPAVGWCALGSLVLAGQCAVAPAAFAQTIPQVTAPPGASQITPPSFRPPLQDNSGRGLTVPGTPGIETPPGAEALFVRLSGVKVEGAFPEMARETQALEARLASGTQVSGAAIFESVRGLEAAYARAGYVLARVVLPPQKLDDGAVLRIVVVDGFIERIETKDLPDRVRDRIASIVAPLVNRPRLKLREIERRLLLAGDTPGVILRSTLAAGSTTGATVLALDANWQAADVLLNLDNALSPSLGSYNLGAGFDTNSVLGLGELVYVRALGNPNGGTNGFFSDNPLNRTLAGGIVIPIGTNGFTFNIEGTEARTAPIPTVVGLQSTDLFQRLSTRLRYAWLRSRQLNVALETAFDVESDSQTLMFAGTSSPLAQDRLNVLRFNTEGDYLTPWGAIISGRVSTSFGLNALGARTASVALASGIPLSRQGTDANFQKIEASLNYSQAVADQFRVNLYGRGQFSFGQALARAEQIGLVGPQALSSFDAGTLQGDSGFAVRAEVSRPIEVPLIIKDVGFVASPYIFGAVGQVFLAAPTAVEQASIEAASYGFGLKLNNGQRGTLLFGALSLELAAQQRNDGVPTSNRFSLLFSQRF